MRGGPPGEVSEWPKEQHWKCCMGLKPHRGFESLPLRIALCPLVSGCLISHLGEGFVLAQSTVPELCQEQGPARVLRPLYVAAQPPQSLWSSRPIHRCGSSRFRVSASPPALKVKRGGSAPT